VEGNHRIRQPSCVSSRLYLATASMPRMTGVDVFNAVGHVASDQVEGTVFRTGRASDSTRGANRSINHCASSDGSLAPSRM